MRAVIPLCVVCALGCAPKRVGGRELNPADVCPALEQVLLRFIGPIGERGAGWESFWRADEVIGVLVELRGKLPEDSVWLAPMRCAWQPGFAIASRESVEAATTPYLELVASGGETWTFTLSVRPGGASGISVYFISPISGKIMKTSGGWTATENPLRGIPLRGARPARPP